MIREFSKYGKWKDYFDIRNFEVRISLVISFITLVFFVDINFYSIFDEHKELCNNAMLYSIAGMFGLLGFSLSGIAIIISIFGNEDLLKIKDNDIMKKVMSSFCFLAFNIGVAIFIYFLYYFGINLLQDKANVVLFYILVEIYVYSIFFIIFYTVALVRNCVWLYQIKTQLMNMENVVNKEDLNEIRIDSLFLALSKRNIVDQREMKVIFEQLVRQSSIENKDKAMHYFDKRYGFSKDNEQF